MTISMPLTSKAKKHSAVIQWVTRTSAEWRGAAAAAGMAEAELGKYAESATGEWYQFSAPLR